MKVEIVEIKLFKPIKIILETEKEANLFWHLLNNNGDWQQYKEKNEVSDVPTKDEMWNVFSSIHQIRR